MIELTWIPGALRALGWLYVILALTALFFALVKPKTGMRKALWSLGVIALFGVLPGISFYVSLKEEQAKQEAERQAYQMKLAAAMAHFEMRCKNAGEKIVKTVENVEGVFLMKIRPDEINYGDQFKLDDPYGHDYGNDGYIKSFLWGRDETRRLGSLFAAYTGYRYVEALDPENGARYRYTGFFSDPDHFQLKKTLAEGNVPRYGVTYDDISTPEDRKVWVAGSSLRVIDLQTNQVIAERIGYMIDKGQGSRGGARSPWLFAAYNACPSFPPLYPKTNFPVEQLGQTRNFVEKILKPTTQQGTQK